MLIFFRSSIYLSLILFFLNFFTQTSLSSEIEQKIIRRVNLIKKNDELKSLLGHCEFRLVGEGTSAEVYEFREKPYSSQSVLGKRKTGMKHHIIITDPFF